MTWIIHYAIHNLHYEKFQDGTVKCIEDEIPFEVPEGWAWCRISSICIINPRNQMNDDTNVSFVSMPCICEGYANSHTSDIRKWEKVKTGYTHFQENDIGIAKITPCFENRKSVIFKNLISGSGAGTTELHILRTIKQCVNEEYLLYIFKTNGFISSGIAAFTGAVGQKRIGAAFISNYLIPLPPFKEQIEIAEKITKIFDSISTMDVNIINIGNEINSTKSKILDLAIKGKLVPQDTTEDPASVLLERIRAEKEELINQGKIKRDKNDSVIYKGDDNSYYEQLSDGNNKNITSQLPFNLPQGWAWERLGNISTIARGGSPRPIKAFITTESDGVNWIKIGDTEKNGKYIFSTREKIKPEGMSKSRYVKSGDFLLTNSMSFGRPYILKTDGCIHDGWLVVGNVEKVFNQDFLYYALSADFMYKTLAILAGGSTVDNLNSDLVKSVMFPVPPIYEQERIVKAIEKSFAYLDQMSKALS